MAKSPQTEDDLEKRRTAKSWLLKASQENLSWGIIKAQDSWGAEVFLGLRMGVQYKQVFKM